MSYIPPSLSLEIVLQPQVVAPPLPLNVTLCTPDLATDVTVTVAASGSVGGIISASITASEPSAAYTPPPLSVPITLKQQILPPPDLSEYVILCRPKSNGDDVNATVSASATVGGIIAASVAAAEPQPVDVTVNAVGSVGGSITANAAVEEYFTGVTIVASGKIGGKVSATATYDSNVFRGFMSDTASDLQSAKLAGTFGGDGFEDASIIGASKAVNRETAKLEAQSQSYLFEANKQLYTSEQASFESSKLTATNSNQLFESQNFIGSKSSLKQEAAKLVGESDWLGFEAMAYRQIERALFGEQSRLIGDSASSFSEQAKFAELVLHSLAETARLPKWSTVYVPPPLSQTIILKQQIAPPSLPLDVVLCAPQGFRASTKLTVTASGKIKGLINAQITAAEGGNSDYSKGFIFVTNSVNLKRTDDGRNITLLSFSVGIDTNSYCWSFNASVPIGELSKVNTALESRIGVDLTVNGHLWRFILDGCEDSAAFGERSLTIKGKSRAMLLAHPYAKHRGYKYDTAMTARQIAEDELNRNNVPSGFTLDWDLVGVNGWNIPANTYSYSGRTPINSLQWIAEAAGGFINSDMAADILHVKALYPVKSWQWYLQTPELVLPQSLILNRTRSRVTKPNYNGVNVWGERDGSVGALVKRTGTSGGYQPPMITSDLITDYDVATARGIAVLSDVGEVGNIGITMPMHADFGVLKPSTLIGVNDGEQWVGMVRGTSISGKLGSNRALEIEQTLDIERHFDKEGA